MSRSLGGHASAMALVLFVTVTAVIAQTPTSPGGMISVDEIRPGMRGYGLTVFRGTTPTRFDVEVIDVLHNFRPDQDLILIRTDHPILDEAHVVAGMSGSPVYLDGRLAGAYAYGWPFSQDPVAGVTPIRNMLNELRRPIDRELFPGLRTLSGDPTRTRRPRVRARHAAYLGDTDVTATTALEAHTRRIGLRADGDRRRHTLSPAATPLLVGGMDDATIDTLDEQLGRFGLLTLQAGGAGAERSSANAPTRHVPGGAIGVQLVRGDIALTAVGTVTHVEGNRAAAFGHPMLNAGQTGLPTAVARVLHVLSSQARSFKISEPVRTLGTLVHDRQSAIVVDSSVEAAGVEGLVRIHGVEGAARTEWRFTTASHRVLTPVLLAAAISNAVNATAADNQDVMIEARSRVWVSGRAAPVESVDTVFANRGVTPVALRSLRLFAYLEAAYGNPFEVARATRVEVDLRLRYAHETTNIVDASVTAAEVDPGSNVPVRVVLHRWGQPEDVRVVNVPIPERLAGETVSIRIEAGSGVRPQRPQPRGLDDVLTAVDLRYPTTSMVVSVRTASRGLRFAGHVVRHLPASALDTLQLENDADRARPFITQDRREVPLDAVVSGGAEVRLRVRRRRRP